MFSTGSNTMDIKEEMNNIDEFTLLDRYLGISKLPCVINSPLREDNNASFGLYTKDGNRIYWTDFATKESGGIYDLLTSLWQCSLVECIIRIVKDDPNIIKVTKKRRKKGSYSSNSELKCKVREWRDHDISYWESYGISLKWLKYAEVYPISYKIVIKNGVKLVMKADKYAYAYVEHKEGKDSIKIYQPFNTKGYKWSNKHDRSTISLWSKVPETGDRICICSSLKDALCLWENTGIPSLAIQGEGYGMSNTAINELKRRYKEIYILLDNDKVGIEDGISLSEETGFTNLVLPKFEGGKDISDLFKVKGKQQFNLIINNLFKI